VLISIILYILAVSSTALAQTPESSAKGPKDFVSALLPYKLDFVRDHINLEFNSNDRTFFEDYNGAVYTLPGEAKTVRDLSPQAYKKFIAFPIVRPNKFYVFYGAYPNMQQHLQEITSFNVAGLNNPALQRYASLPAEARSNDIYLWSPDTPYWYSEYSMGGNPLPFRSYFIVHLTEADAHHTTVEIIEDKPVVNRGKKLTVDANGVVHRFDIADIPSTTSDREFLLSCISQFIERKLPNRRVFNCKGE